MTDIHDKFEPELGQVIFGNPTGEFKCPTYVIEALSYLGGEIEDSRRDIKNPTHNTGSQFKNDTFEMRAYYWGDDEEQAILPNFKYGDFEVRWYKYLARGTSMNRPITRREMRQILKACLGSLR